MLVKNSGWRKVDIFNFLFEDILFFVLGGVIVCLLLFVIGYVYVFSFNVLNVFEFF